MGRWWSWTGNTAGAGGFYRTYAYTRNPLYLGHLIFLTGLTLTLQSWLAAIITVGVAVWFHCRVLGDEKKLAVKLGQPYIDYMEAVKRWIPGGF